MKRGSGKESKRTQTAEQEGGDGEESGGEERFFACYLLTSLCPRFKGHTYIGFTVNPRRRIRQHNGEVCSGAWRTKKKRPWEMVLCIYGFPTNVAALQFEWAWQHPAESLAVRQAAASFKSLSGLANKIKLAYTMLTLPSWHSLKLTVNFFSTKYREHMAGCPSLPQHIGVQVCSMDELPCYSRSNWNLENDAVDHDEDCEGNDGSQESTELGYVDSANNLDCGKENDHEGVNQRDEIFNVKNAWLEQIGTKKPTDSTISREPDTEPSHLIASPVRASISVEDSHLFQLTKESIDESYHPLEDQSPNTVICDEDCDPHKSRAKCDIEVIDLFTPSPRQSLSARGSKKRRLFTSCTEIIDLTLSPS